MSFSRSRSVAALTALALALLCAACPSTDASVAVNLPEPVVAVKTPPVPAAKPSVDPADHYTRNFDPDRAWKHLTKQVEFGPRVPNTAGHRACRRYLEQELLAVCDVVEKQDFEVPQAGGALKMTNLIGRFRVDQPRRLILGAHWDTRPTADKNPPGQRNQPIDGANDGASGVAVLLELARLFKENPPPIGVDIVLFDGEDYGPGQDMMFLGAKHFASRLSTSQARAYNYGILLDMVGDRELDIVAENHSHAVAPLVFDVAYDLSRELGYSFLKRSSALTIYDDHLPLIERGVKMYCFIDFNYPYWHTTRDTVDKCSAESLGAIGRTVENMVYLFPNIYE